MLILLLGLLFGLFNAVRGSGAIQWFNRVTSSLLSGISAGAFVFLENGNLHLATIIVGATFFTLWAALAPGWGIGFACVTGRRNLAEEEIPLLDKIAASFCENDNTIKDNRKFGLMWMTLRSSFFYAIFTTYSMVNLLYGLDIVLPLIAGVLCLLMGWVYWLSFYLENESNRIRVSEFVYGFILGVAVGISLISY